MIVDITVPELGESINEVEIGEWLVSVGDQVGLDDELVTIESDKATVELPSPQPGTIVEILKKDGMPATIGEVIARLDTAMSKEEGVDSESADKSQKEQQASVEETSEKQSDESRQATASEKKKVMPAAARIMAEEGLSSSDVETTGPGGRILKEDARRSADQKKSHPPSKQEKDTAVAKEPEERGGERREPMSPIRRTIAARLLEATRNMALLTTFNEVDMSQVMQLRKTLGQEFLQKHDVKLGFMSFFVRATVSALLDFPLVNSSIDGTDIVYHDYCDIGVAIGGGKGLVVPVIREAERLSFADIEKKIAEFAEKAKGNKLSMDELKGGTFTISNGGVYGSMLSTPIVNPPQSAILGLHAIKERPVAVDGEVVIRPVMYLALSYDHRIIDGREAVSFLKSIKERIEDPRKLLLEI